MDKIGAMLFIGHEFGTVSVQLCDRRGNEPLIVNGPYTMYLMRAKWLIVLLTRIWQATRL